LQLTGPNPKPFIKESVGTMTEHNLKKETESSTSWTFQKWPLYHLFGSPKSRHPFCR